MRIPIDSVSKKPVWWAWGDGGHKVVSDFAGKRIVAVQPKVPGQLNNPLPQWSTNMEELTAMPKNYSGWVLKHHERKQTIEEFNQGIAVVEYDYAYFFLRRLEDVTENRIVIKLNNVQLYEMRSARKSFLELTDKEDDELVKPMLTSEVALYDEDLKFIGSINPFYSINSGGFDSIEILIDTRSAEQIAASDAAWKRSERERVARGALM